MGGIVAPGGVLVDAGIVLGAEVAFGAVDAGLTLPRRGFVAGATLSP